MISRRVFFKEGGLAVGLSMVPGFLQRTVMAAAPEGRRKTLVVIFQRGGADGLNMVAPFGEAAYYRHRPTIAIPAPGKGPGAAVDLDGRRRLVHLRRHEVVHQAAERADQGEHGRQPPAPAQHVEVVPEVELRAALAERQVERREVVARRAGVPQKKDSLTSSRSPDCSNGSASLPASTAL